MAVIPQIVTSPGAVPGAPSAPSGGGVPRASSQIDVRAPSDPSAAQVAGANIEAGALESTARSAEKMAQYGEQFAEKYVTAKLNIDAANRTADMSALLHQAEFESSKIADRDAATADFDGRAAKIRDDFAAQDVNPRVRAAVDASLPNQISLRRASTQNAAFGLWGKAQVGSLITNLDQYNKQAVDSQDPRLTEQLIGQANAAIDGRVEGGALAADVAAKMKVDFESNVYRTKIEVAMSKDMRTGLALFEATKGRLNAQDTRAMGIMAYDRSKQVDAETEVSRSMPRFGQSGGGDIGAVRADAEKAIGVPLTITSADRTEAQNKAVGGATGSQHLVPGKALDISLAGLSDEQKQKVYQHFLNDPRVGGIGFYAGHLHVDARSGPRTTWGTPPAAVGDQVKAWQAGGPGPPTGDQLSQYKIDAYRYRQSIVDNLALDPEVKARQLQIIDQRLGMTNNIVVEQRKSASDAAEKAGVDLFTGKYKPGTFQGIADQFRAAGDSSQAEVYDFMATHEAQLIEMGKTPPAQMPTFGALLPGAAGRIAQQQVAEARATEVEKRQLAAQHRAENIRLSGEQEKIVNDSIDSVDPRIVKRNMLDAIAYANQAGDTARAQRLAEEFSGMLDAADRVALPPAERERAKLELLEVLNKDSKGLTRQQASALKLFEKGAGKNTELWAQDPLVAANNLGVNRGGIALQPFNSNMDGVNLQMWATQRLKDATTTTLAKNRDATNVEVPFFTVAEMSDISQKLDRMRPQEAKNFLARLAAAVPAQAIALIGEQMSKKDAVSDSYAAALGLYKRGQPGDVEIADRIVVGMNLWQKGGEDGKTRVAVNAALFSEIDRYLGTARVHMTPDAIRQQNNAIIANYVALTANTPERTTTATQSELQTSILQVVGRPYSHNGVATIIPREIQGYQFKDGVAAITDADTASLRATDSGQAIDAATVRRHGIFVPTGDGKYQVRIPDPLRAGTTVQVIDNNTGRPWEVDIKPLIARGVSSTGASGGADNSGYIPAPRQ